MENPLVEYAALPLNTAGGDHHQQQQQRSMESMEEARPQQKESSKQKEFNRNVTDRLNSLAEVLVETRGVTALGILATIVLMVAALIWLIPISAVLGGTVDGVHQMNHTLLHDHKVIDKHLQPEVLAIQDYLVANVFDPCPNSRCQTERLIQMFGGELPSRYQHYLVGVWANNQEYDNQEQSQVAG